MGITKAPMIFFYGNRGGGVRVLCLRKEKVNKWKMSRVLSVGRRFPRRLSFIHNVEETLCVFIRI